MAGLPAVQWACLPPTAAAARGPETRASGLAAAPRGARPNASAPRPRAATAPRPDPGDQDGVPGAHQRAQHALGVLRPERPRRPPPAAQHGGAARARHQPEVPGCGRDSDPGGRREEVRARREAFDRPSNGHRQAAPSLRTQPAERSHAGRLWPLSTVVATSNSRTVPHPRTPNPTRAPPSCGSPWTRCRRSWTRWPRPAAPWAPLCRPPRPAAARCWQRPTSWAARLRRWRPRRRWWSSSWTSTSSHRTRWGLFGGALAVDAFVLRGQVSSFKRCTRTFCVCTHARTVTHTHAHSTHMRARAGRRAPGRPGRPRLLLCARARAHDPRQLPAAAAQPPPARGAGADGPDEPLPGGRVRAPLQVCVCGEGGLELDDHAALQVGAYQHGSDWGPQSHTR